MEAVGPSVLVGQESADRVVKIGNTANGILASRDEHQSITDTVGFVQHSDSLGNSLKIIGKTSFTVDIQWEFGRPSDPTDVFNEFVADRAGVSSTIRPSKSSAGRCEYFETRRSKQFCYPRSHGFGMMNTDYRA
jgi:hypothetical protein